MITQKQLQQLAQKQHKDGRLSDKEFLEARLQPVCHPPKVYSLDREALRVAFELECG